MDKSLLNLKEFCEVLNIGETKARELIRHPRCTYSLQIGRRWYVNKKKLEKWLEEQ